MLTCPWCDCPRSGHERTCMGCSRPLPLQQLGPATRDLGLAVDGGEQFSAELHALSVSQVLESFGQALLSEQMDLETYQAKLGWLERRLLAVVNELKAGLNQGKLALRRAGEPRRQVFEEFEAEARPLLNTMLEHFLDCLDCMRQLGQSREPDWLQDALASAEEGMQRSQGYEELCRRVEAELYPSG
ncbi:MAG: hypothetical protein U0931_14190 [Vulcanimicrobiota bacterium]